MERKLQRNEVSCICRPHFDACQEAFEIKDFLAMRLHIFAQRKICSKFCYAVQASFNLLGREQRIFQPFA